MNIEPEKLSKAKVIAKLRLTGKDAIFEGYQLKNEIAIEKINQVPYGDFWVEEFLSYIKIV
jgi:hypothetical protein